MAGDWIKIEHATPDKPEIVAMAASLGIDQDAVFGKCVRLWIWADQQSQDGNALSVTDSFIDRCTFCAGFAGALRKVGWLSGRDSRLSIPNFGKHNGQSAKQRANTNARVAKSRKSRNAPSVTESEQKPLPEKRREEKRNTHTHTPAEGFEKDWQRWLDYRESSDSRPLDPIQADAVLMDLLRRGAEKAATDIDFSIRKGSRSILDSDNDFEKNRAASRSGGRKPKVELDL